MMPDRSHSVQPRSTLASPSGRDRTGKVYLVGAGPGDPGLITLRGKECLERADVVLFDGLANPELLTFAARAEHISVGKHGSVPIWTQIDIHDKLVALAKQGKHVVRLKGGDPAVFARTAEELEVLVEAGIPFEVIPGITAALAASSYVGIPITHRQHASAVAFVTGQQQTRETPQPIDWTALAQFPGTLVFYMGVTTVQQWTKNLLLAGKPPETPAAIVRRCTWSDQTVLRCQLSEVAGLLTPASKMRPPVIVIVGSVAALGAEMDWFASRPLRRCGVLSTRPAGQTGALSALLRDLGADVYHQAMLQIVPPPNWSAVDDALVRISRGEFSGITFSSANGVEAFLNRLFETGHDARLLAGLSLAAVGPATARSMHRFGLKADFCPEEGHQYGASALLEALDEGVRGSRWIVTTTNRSRDTLRQGLVGAGADVLELLCYRTKPVKTMSVDVTAAIKAGRIQLCTITSQAIAEAACRALGEWRSHVQPVSLSASISERLRQLDWPPLEEAEQRSDESLVEAIQRAYQRI